MNSQLYLFLLHPMNAISYFGNGCTDLTGNDCSTGLPKGAANSANLHNILQIVFAVLAAISVLFIVIAGLRFITAQGNPQEISKAKSTIVYALVGLLVAILAEALVAFTLGKLG